MSGSLRGLSEQLAADAAGGDLSNLASMGAVAPDSRRQVARRPTNNQIGVAWMKLPPR
jgi:hypothetical protein